MNMLESAKKGKTRAGKANLIKYLEGKRLTQRQAISAKCYDCNGMGEQSDCDIKECALYPYSPFTKKAPGHYVEAVWKKKRVA